jgi:RNA polymerase sigma-70 factor (ECF subfamily)
LSTPAFPDPANIPDLKAPPGGWPQATDEELLRAMKHGVGDAFDALFERHGGVVMSFISRLTARKADPEDLVQETFLRILTHAGDFRPGAAFRPWLFTIARNVTFNALKKGKRRDEWEVRADLADWDPPERAQAALQSAPSARMEKTEQQSRVLAALEDLPAAHREILVLTVFEGFTYEEAAQITGDPEGTLRSRAFHALRKLRDRLKEP